MIGKPRDFSHLFFLRAAVSTATTPSLDEPLERRMTDHAVVSDFRVGNLSGKARLNPRRILLLERLRQRRCGPRQGPT
jgi:hypothetical protein